MKQAVRMTVLLAAMVIPVAAAGDGFSIRADETVEEAGGSRKILRGNVVIEFEDLRFEADEVTQHFEQQQPVKYEATGQPVVVEQKGGALAGLEQGTCRKLVYLVRDKTLLLSDYELRLSNGSVQRGERLKLVLE